MSADASEVEVRRALRYGGAALLVVSGLVHVRLYQDGYRDFPNANLGRSFLLNAVACGIVAVALVVHGSSATALAGLAVANGTLIGFALSRTDRGVFAFTERGFAPRPDAAISVIVEIGAALALLLVLALDARDARLRA